MQDQPTIVGIDIGGSHITAGFVDATRAASNGQSFTRRSVDPCWDADGILSEWSDTIKQVTNGRTDVKFGVAIPGPFDYAEGVSFIKGQGKFELLYRVNVKRQLARKLAVSPEAIHLMNDAGCFLQGEAFLGAARGYKRAIGLTLGTGLGSAMCKEGLAKDIGLWNSSFKDGIAEDYLSTRWFVSQFYHKTGLRMDGVKEIMESGQDGVVSELFDDFSTNLSQFLIPLIERSRPDVVVLGGNIANADYLFLGKVREYLSQVSIDIPVYRALLGEKAAMIGAASYWHRAEGLGLNPEEGV